MKIVIYSLGFLMASLVYSQTKTIDCLKSMRVGTFQYDGVDVQIIRNDSLNIEVFNGSKIIEEIEWLNDSIYVMTQREAIGTETGCIKNGDKVWVTILTCDNNRYTFKWKSENCGEGIGQHTIVKIE